ncbi:Txe/YoeB family addiction module toxin [Aquiluna sp.]|nr:Txe/YoeB family addiction module toxin [Aquiluna sp.]
MTLSFTSTGWSDYLWWQKYDPKVLLRINKRIADTLGNPKSGLGNPKPLRFSDLDAWSRRVNLEHRMVYVVNQQEVVVIQLRYHY